MENGMKKIITNEIRDIGNKKERNMELSATCLIV